MKILFLMDSPEYLRFYDSAIEELAARGHAVAIAVNSQRTKKPVGLEGLRAYADRVSVLGVVPEAAAVWADAGRSVRATMDFVRFLHPTFAAAPALRARVKRKVLPRAYHWLDRIPRIGADAVRATPRRSRMTFSVPPCGATSSGRNGAMSNVCRSERRTARSAGPR